MLSQIDITICTVSRDGNYIDATVESIAEDVPISRDNPVRLVAGSPAVNYLQRYRSCPGIEIVEMGPSAWALMKNSRVRYRATWNYYRCLAHGTGRRGSLIFEDDVHLAHGWRERLEATITELEQRYNSDFMLSLYYPKENLSAVTPLFGEWERERFYGTQGMYYPASMRERCARYLKKHGVIANDNFYDYLLREYALAEGYVIPVCTPSLVQHMGRKGTGLGTWHFAPDFVEDVTGLPLR